MKNLILFLCSIPTGGAGWIGMVGGLQDQSTAQFLFGCSCTLTSILLALHYGRPIANQLWEKQRS